MSGKLKPGYVIPDTTPFALVPMSLESTSLTGLKLADNYYQVDSEGLPEDLAPLRA
jgi:hypothetical protein